MTAHAQTTADSQWRTSPLTLSTLLQDGYKIVAVVNSAAGSVETIFVQRDQSAFKCFDPQQSDARTKALGASPACFELVPLSGAAPGSEPK